MKFFDLFKSGRSYYEEDSLYATFFVLFILEGIMMSALFLTPVSCAPVENGVVNLAHDLPDGSVAFVNSHCKSAFIDTWLSLVYFAIFFLVALGAFISWTGAYLTQLETLVEDYRTCVGTFASDAPVRARRLQKIEADLLVTIWKVILLKSMALSAFLVSSVGYLLWLNVLSGSEGKSLGGARTGGVFLCDGSGRTSGYTWQLIRVPGTIVDGNGTAVGNGTGSANVTSTTTTGDPYFETLNQLYGLNLTASSEPVPSSLTLFSCTAASGLAIDLVTVLVWIVRALLLLRVSQSIALLHHYRSKRRWRDVGDSGGGFFGRLPTVGDAVPNVVKRAARGFGFGKNGGGDSAGRSRRALQSAAPDRASRDDRFETARYPEDSPLSRHPGPARRAREESGNPGGAPPVSPSSRDHDAGFVAGLVRRVNQQRDDFDITPTVDAARRSIGALSDHVHREAQAVKRHFAAGDATSRWSQGSRPRAISDDGGSMSSSGGTRRMVAPADKGGDRTAEHGGGAHGDHRGAVTHVASRAVQFVEEHPREAVQVARTAFRPRLRRQGDASPSAPTTDEGGVGSPSIEMVERHDGGKLPVLRKRDVAIMTWGAVKDARGRTSPNNAV